VWCEHPVQVLEILSHINKRVKGHDTISLPLADLVSVYADTTHTMVRNFAIVYVEMGYNRCVLPQSATFRATDRLLLSLHSTKDSQEVGER